jgi:hypothetical protein
MASSSATASKKPKLASERDEKWIRDLSNLVHKGFIHMIHPDDHSTVTFIYDESQREHVATNLKNLNVGCKVENKSSNAGKTDIKILGKIPPGSLIGHHASKSSLPPCISFESYCCVRKDCDRHTEAAKLKRKSAEQAKRKEKAEAQGSTKSSSSTFARTATVPRVTHILEEDDEECAFRANIRDLRTAHGTMYVALTFDHESCLHTCPTNTAHLAPLTPNDDALLIALLLKHGSPKAVWEKVISPMTNEHDARTEVFTRLHKMDESEINKFAKKHNLEQTVRPGRPDLEELGRVLRDLKNKGANVAFKLPGHESFSCDMLSEDARKHLKRSDLFIMVQSADQIKLLELFSGSVGTDGTHQVLSYYNAKVITVNVTSFGKVGVTERGFPVAVIVTTSEREDIHLAIVAQLQSVQKPGWAPKLLMSDMAFAAFNAWVKAFPRLRWLFCVFHVWQAWIKKLRHTTRPSGMDQDGFSRLKGHLIREIKDLISPPHGKAMTWDEFNERAEKVRLIMWASGLTDLATSWEQYLARKDKWAPPARREAVDEAFGSGSPFPMLAVSNNSVERFFGVLKYILLGGKSALTICALLQVWIIHGARIRINAVKAGIPLDALLPDAPNRLNTVLANDVADFEDAINQAEAAEEEAEAVAEEEAEAAAEANSDDVGDEVGENELQSGAGDEMHGIRQIFRRIAARSPEERVSAQLIASVDELVDVTTLLKNWVLDTPHASIEVKRNLLMPMNRFVTTLRSAMAQSDEVDVAELGAASLRPLIRQRENFGVSDSTLEACTAALTRKPRERNKKRDEELCAKLAAEPFTKFAEKMMQQATFAAQVKSFQDVAAKSDFPMLRVWLKKNNCTRICAVGKFNLGLTIMSMNWKKDRMIDAIVSEVKSRFSLLSEEDQSLVGDFGVLLEDSEDLYRDDLICLRVNAVDNLGDPCVVSCQFIQAWVIREARIECVDVELSRVQWCRLSENRKDLNDFKKV